MKRSITCRTRYLIEEHILPVCAFSCELLNNPLWADAMLCTQLLPKLKTDCKTDRDAGVRCSR